MKKTVIIDCDPGIDDAIALMVAVENDDELELRAVTTVAGNQTLEHTCRNAQRILSYLSCDAPVGRGAAAPLKKTLQCAPEVHGEDGLGGMRIPQTEEDDDPVSAQTLLVSALTEQEEDEYGKAVIIATGPLTNLAELFINHPQLKENIDHITLMGGSAGEGNASPYAEFNFYTDPDAANIVFSSGVPIIMLGLDVTHRAYLTAEDVEAVARRGTRNSGMVEDLMVTYGAYYQTTGLPGVPIHDASAVAFELRPSLFTDVRPARISIITEGERQGQSVVAFDGVPNAKIVLDVDREAFVKFIDGCCRH